MRSRRRLAASAVVGGVASAVTVVACSLTTDLSALTGGGADAFTDAGPAPTDGFVDADAASPVDAAASAYRSAVMADAPIGFWRLGEKTGSVMNDEMGAHAGTYTAPVSLGAVGALSNDTDTAVRFSATGHAVVTTGFDFAGGTPFSVEVWINPTTIVGADYYFPVGKRVMSPFRGWAVYVHEARVCGELSNTSFNGTCAPIVAGRFSHVVFTYDGATCRVYVDGAEASRDPCGSVVVPVTTTPLTIGAVRPGSGSFDGTIDEVALYDRALTPDRITAHFDAASP